MSFSLTITILILLTVFFQDIVAAYMGYIPIPAMDQGTMIGGSGLMCNYINCTCYDVECDMEIVKARFREGMKIMPKLRYKIVEFAGDYYY